MGPWVMRHLVKRPVLRWMQVSRALSHREHYTLNALLKQQNKLSNHKAHSSTDSSTLKHSEATSRWSAPQKRRQHRSAALSLQTDK